MQQDNKVIKVSKEFIEILESLRETIRKSVGSSIADDLGMEKLTKILAEKIKKGGFVFKFP